MLIIRQAEMSDLEQIVAIENCNFPPREAASESVLAERITKTADTFLVAELAGQLAGYIEGPVTDKPVITDNLFQQSQPNPQTGGYLAVTSLSVAPAFQGQGLGTALLAAFKDLAVAHKRSGITLTCHDYLISYYEMNGFSDQGLSESAHGGSVWYDLLWKNPEINVKSR